MRVLLVPELYRRGDATANGTLNDLLPLVERWLAASFDDEDRPALDVPGYTITDLLCALRGLGYRDLGNPGTPFFEPANPQREASANAEASP